MGGFRNAVLAGLAALGLSLWAIPPAFAVDAAPASSADGWVARGQQAYAAGQLDQAITDFSSAAQADRGNAAAWSGLGNSFYAKHDYASALKYYRFALQLHPGDNQLAAFVQHLADLTLKTDAAANAPAAQAARLSASGNYDQAVVQYKAAIAANPNNAKAYQGLGNAYYALKQKPEAVAAYRRCLEIAPDNAALKSFLARYAPDDARAEGVQVATSPADWTQPAWRSALLPGWGQAFNGDTGKGWVIGGLTVAALIGTIATYAAGDAARTDYNTYGSGVSQSKFDSAYNTWNSMANYNNALALATLALYTFNIADAIMEAKPVTQAVGLAPGEEPALRLGLLGNGSVGAQVRVLSF